MSKSHLLKYLLISPNLPVGGFCYSEGMESFLNARNLTDSNSVKELIISELEIGEDMLLTKGDYVIENMLKNFNVDIVSTQKKFFPERGAHSHE